MPRRPHRTVQRLAGVCVVIVALSALTACSPIVDGRTGITRDADGGLIGLAKACDGEFDGAGIYQNDDQSSTASPVRLARWQRDTATGDLITWALLEGSPSSWSTSEPLATDALKRGHTYMLDAWGANQKWSADELRFTVTDVEGVNADTVLIARADPKTGAVRSAKIPRRDFEALACQS